MIPIRRSISERRLPAAMFLAALIWVRTAAGGDGGLASFYDGVQPAAVEVLVEGHLAGSGCLVDKDGLVLTAAHVLGQPGRVCEINVPTLGRLRAAFVAVDLGHDLLLLRLPPRENGYPLLPQAEALPPAGSEVFLFGAPAYRHGALQRGMLVRDRLTFEYQGHFVEVVQIQAGAQEGTSGGPWLNRQGEVIGVQSGTVDAGKHPGGIANAAPLTAIRALIQTKRNAATTAAGMFVDELWVLPADVIRRFPPGTEGMFIQQVNDGSPAARAGLQKGDVLTAAAGRPVRYRDEYVRTYRERKPGDTLEVTVLRPDGAGTRQATLTLGCLEIGWPQSKP